MRWKLWAIEAVVRWLALCRIAVITNIWQPFHWDPVTLDWIGPDGDQIRHWSTRAVFESDPLGRCLRDLLYENFDWPMRARMYFYRRRVSDRYHELLVRSQSAGPGLH